MDLRVFEYSMVSGWKRRGAKFSTPLLVRSAKQTIGFKTTHLLVDATLSSSVPLSPQSNMDIHQAG